MLVTGVMIDKTRRTHFSEQLTEAVVGTEDTDGCKNLLKILTLSDVIVCQGIRGTA